MVGVGARSILRNTLFTTASNLVGLFAKVIYVIFLAKYLGPEKYGLLAYALSFYILFLPLTILGLNSFLIRELGSSPASRESIIGRYLGLRIIAISITVVIYGLTVSVFFESNILNLQLILILSLIGRSFTLWNEGLFTGIERTQETLKLQATWRLLEALAGIILLAFGADIMIIALVHVISWLGQAFMGYRRVKRIIPHISPFFSKHELINLLIKGWPLALAGLFVSWSLQGPIVMYKHLSDSTDLGQLALAFQVFSILMMIPVSLSTASLPVLTRTIERKDKKDDLYVFISLRVILIFSALLGVGAIALSGPVFSMVLGSEYALAANLAGYFIWLLAPFSIGSIMRSIAFTHGKINEVLIYSGLSAGIFSVLAVWLIPVMGTVGAFWSAMFAFTFSSMLASLPYIRKLNYHQKKAIILSLVIFILTMVLSFSTIQHDNLIQLFLGVFFVIVTVILFGVISKKEYHNIKNILKKTSTKLRF